MANRSRQSFAKRQKERARQERNRLKAEKRHQRKTDHEKPQVIAGEDPDIAGIVPGPQPLPWEEEESVPAPPTEEEAAQPEGETAPADAKS